MQKLKGLVLTTFIAFSSAFFVELTVPVDFAEKVEAACAPGQYFDEGSGGCQKADSGNSPEEYVKGDLKSRAMNIYNILASTLGAFSILTIIYGGYLMMTSAGNPARAFIGKYTVFTSGIAILIILSSYTIVRLASSFLKL